jgi:hypothetical protein
LHWGVAVGVGVGVGVAVGVGVSLGVGVGVSVGVGLLLHRRRAYLSAIAQTLFAFSSNLVRRHKNLNNSITPKTTHTTPPSFKSRPYFFTYVSLASGFLLARTTRNPISRQ